MTTFVTVSQLPGSFSGAILQDTAENLQGMSTSLIADLDNEGIVAIDSLDDGLSFTVDQINALDPSVALDGSDIVVLSDTSTKIGSQNAAFFARLDSIGFVAISPTDGVLSLSVQKYQAMGSIAVDGSATVTLDDSGAAIAGLSASKMTALGAAGIDIVKANGTLFLTAAQATALAEANITLTLSDDVTIQDTGANIANMLAADLAKLVGLDHVDATDNHLSLSVAQYLALPANALTDADTITLLDTGAHIGGPAGLTPSQFAALGANHIDQIHSSTGTLFLSVDQYQNLVTSAVPLTPVDTVTIRDLGTTLVTLDFTGLAAHNIDVLDASDDTLVLDAAKFGALSTVKLLKADNVTVSDTDTNLQALNFATLDSKNVDKIDATNDKISLSLLNLSDLGNVAVDSSDAFTIADTAVALQGLLVSDIDALATKGVDFLHATGGTLSLSVAQIAELILKGIHLTSGDTVTLADTGGAIAGLSSVQIGALHNLGVDKIDASSALDLTVAQYDALNGVALTDANTVTIVDTGANIATLDFSGLATNHVDALKANGALTISATQYNALNGVALTDSDTVTIADTDTNLQALIAANTATTIDLAGTQVDVLDSTTGLLTVSLADITALGSVALTAGDDITVADSEAHLEGLSTVELAALAAKGVDNLDSSSNTLNVDAAYVDQVVTSHLNFASGDTVTVVDTGANIAGLSLDDLGHLASIHVDGIHATDSVSLTTAQYVTLGTSVPITSAMTVTLLDTGAAIAALSKTQVEDLKTAGFQFIDSTTNLLSLTVDQYKALGTVALTPSDIVTLADLGSNIASLNATAIGQLAGNGIDVIDATDNTLALTVAKYLNLGVVNLTPGDTVTLRDTGANIASLNAGQLAALPGNAVDKLDATDNLIVLSLAKAVTLGSGQLSSDDVIVINGTNATQTINGFAFKDIIRGNGGNDRLNGNGGDDLLAGGTGRDFMTGGAGHDKFLFNTQPVPGNVDRIADFTHSQDMVLLENAVYTAAGPVGVLTANRFAVGTAAHDASDRIIYDRVGGNLYYDPDGTGAHAKVLIAKIGDHLGLTHADFFVV